MRMIFMGKDKDSVADALEYLIQLGVEIVTVVTPFFDDQSNSKLYDIAKSFQLPTYSDIEIYQYLNGSKIINLDLKNIDMVVSFLFPKKIKKPLIDLSRLGCVNFHSAPLPKYRGWGVYNAAILNNEQHWGVSAHFVDENFDTGDIIKVNCFDIDPKKETAFSLERRSQKELFKLFNEVMDIAVCGETIPRERQEWGEGSMYTKQETLNYETININDPTDVIDAKIRAFWYPPFTAKIVLDGKRYSLIPDHILENIILKDEEIL